MHLKSLTSVREEILILQGWKRENTRDTRGPNPNFKDRKRHTNIGGTPTLY